MLTAKIAANAEKLRVLEAENVTVQTRNAELGAIIDGTPNNVAPKPPTLTPDNERIVDKTASIAPTDPQRPEQIPDVGTN